MRLRDGVRVVPRGDGAVHVGASAGLVIERLSAAERRLLDRLELSRTVSNKEAAEHPRLVARLTAARVWEAAPPRDAVVGLDGATEASVALGAVLAADGATVCVNDERPLAGAGPTLGATVAAATRQAGAAQAIGRLAPGARFLTGSRRVDLWVIVSEAVPRRDDAAALMASDVPHLYLVTTEHGIDVGPLVIPGESPCGTCAALAATDEDAAWPIVALGLMAPGHVPHPRADVVAAAAGIAAGAVGSWRRGRAEAWLGRVWQVREDAAPVERPLSAHAACGCGAAGDVGDETAARRARWLSGA